MDSLTIEQSPLNGEYKIDSYDLLCEDHFKISKIVPLKYTTGKLLLNIIVHIFTVGLIQFIYGMYPKVEKSIRCSECSLEESDILGIYCQDGNFYFESFKKIEKTKIENKDLELPHLKDISVYILFTFKLFTYIYNPKTKSFSSLKFDIKRKHSYIHQKLNKGLNDSERLFQKMLYGECELNFYIKSFLKTVFDNMCDLFFFFQVYAILLWCLTDFLMYGCIVAVLVLYNLLESSYTTRKNLLNIRNMCKYLIDVDIYENDSIKNMPSSTLVPGDVFELPEDGKNVPCDCILLTGSVIVNEAMLTGESTPILKAHLPNTNKSFDYDEDNKYMLFGGTKIVQKRPFQKEKIICLCYGTGFNTLRGNLIRSVLYPKKADDKFKKDSYKVLKIIGIIFVIGFLAILPKKIKDVIEESKKGEKSTTNGVIDLIVEIADLLTQAVPPELPLCLSICLSIAQSRCKKQNVICINKDKINSAGRIGVCVFDKTGTLTEDHLEIASYVPVSFYQDQNGRVKFKFSKEISNIEEVSKFCYDYYKKKKNDPKQNSPKNEITELFVECLACCQGATKVEGRLIGDPIDVEMIQSAGWQLTEEPKDHDNYDPNIFTYVRPKEEISLTDKLKDISNEEERTKLKQSHYEIGIVRRFDFESKLQRMATIAKSMSEDNYVIFCKGSPEKISELCQEKTIPENFHEILTKYTSKGFRVLALSCKIMKMTTEQVNNIPRELAEKDLIFLGLLIVENKLKETTSEVLKSLLENGRLKVIMATGDNIFTAICVARKSNLIEEKTKIYTCEIEEEEEFEEEKNMDDMNEKYKEGDAIDSNLRLKENIKNIRNNNKVIKRLVWKLVESYYDHEDLDEEEEDDRVSLYLSKKNSMITRKISVLSAVELSCEIEEKNINKSIDNKSSTIDDNISSSIDNSNIIDVRNKNKSKKEKESININEYMNINIDLTDLPFQKDEEDIAFAISGKTFEILYNVNEKYESLQRGENNDESPEIKNNFIHFHEAFRLILRYCSVFGRCSPDNKTQLVQSLQKEGFMVLMCGDGANDCGALKVADVGVSLSQEEASIAAEFTSLNPEISYVINILKEGKCALVTSVEIFKYMIAFSLTEYFAMTLMMFSGTFLTDGECIIIDLFVSLPLCSLLPLIPSHEQLTYHKPYSKLASFPIFISLFIQVVINLIFQIGGLFSLNYFFPKSNLQYEKFRICTKGPKTDEDNCIENSVLFLISYPQFLFVGLVLITAAPFKKNIYSNVILLIYIIVIFIYCFYIIFHGDYLTKKWLLLREFPDDNFRKDDYVAPVNYISFKYYLMGYVFINFLISLFFEKRISNFIIKKWLMNRMKEKQMKIEREEIKPNLNLLNEIRNYTKVNK